MSGSHGLLRSTEWFWALNFAERARGDAPLDTDAALGQRRLDRWREQAPFNGADPADPCELHDCEPDRLAALLGEPAYSLAARVPTPEWLAALQEAFTERTPDGSESEQDRRPEEPFLAVLARPIAAARRDVATVARRLSDESSAVPFDPDAVDRILFQPLAVQLAALTMQPVVLELHAARLAGELAGDTPDERFARFLDRMNDERAALQLLERYPVMARLAMTAIRAWVAWSRELLERLASDWPTLCERFGFAAGDVLENVEALGDRHRGNRRVLVCSFASGGRVVYKPRDVAAEARFQDFLRWIGARAEVPPLRLLTVVERPGYGWVEFVEPFACESPDALRRFYVRQGAYLAILHALGAVDCHYENVIAAGEQPVIVDLECLFQPPLPRVHELDGADALAAEQTTRSVLRVGLLPNRMITGEDAVPLDVSGLGGAAGQQTPMRLPRWIAERTDEMRQVLDHIELPAASNRPVAPEDELSLAAFAEDVAEGYAAVYDAIRAERAALLDPDGPLRGFATARMRCVLRGTVEYGFLLQTSRHPQFLTDGLAREQRYDRLLAGAPAAWPHRTRAVAAERADLWRDDIPLFTTRPSSRSLWTSDGAELPDFFAESGLESVGRRLERLSGRDLEFQTWLIRTSLATASLTGSEAVRPPVLGLARAERDDPHAYVAAACEIADRLAALAIRDGDSATWIGVRTYQGQLWWIDGVTPNLYDGLAGIGLFLAHLGAVTGERRYERLARAAIATMRRQLGREHAMHGIGAFDGLAGCIYALAHIGTLWRADDVLEEARRLVEHLAEHVEEDETHDIVGGAAGAIAVLVGLHRAFGWPELLPVAERCGDQLLATATEVAEGIGWVAPRISSKPLGGFAHGAAGIAWALVELAEETGRERFRTGALAAMSYERTLFSSRHGNWRDMRENLVDKRLLASEDDGDYMSQWCHGAAGIGLGRARSLRLLGDEATRRDVEAAVEATLSTGFRFSHCLCHGDLGNLELLLEAERALGDPTLADRRRELAGEVLASLRASGPATGYPLGLEAPSLMMGTAGIGYGLLRVAAPDRVPSVLLLDPPHVGSS